MCVNQITISKALYSAYWYINYLLPNLIFLIAGRWILLILMFQVIETIGYPDYSCLFCMESLVILCYQAFWFCRSQRNPSGFCKVCFEQREIDLAAQNPCRMLGGSYSKVVIPIADFHTPFFSFLFSLGLAAKRKKPINHCGLISFV